MFLFKQLTSIAWLLFAGTLSAWAAATAEQVGLDLFYSPGCPECERYKREVLPELESRFEGFYELTPHDLNKTETIPLLLAYQQRCGNTDNGRISIVVDHAVFLSGYAVIATGLLDRVNEALVNRQLPGWTPPAPPVIKAEETEDRAFTRSKAITFSVVFFGGLEDGFNPCATSTLIFFMSVLTVAKASRRTRLLVGVAFITASFLVYTLLGLGFLLALRQAPDFPLVKRGFELLLGLCMLPLAALSFRDAFRFRKSQSPDDVTLQIPKKIKARIHAFMSARFSTGGPILGGLVTGAGVTVLESVCTGQGYVPVLTCMLKSDFTLIGLWALLLTYNLLFILPLAVVFICFHRGVQLAVLIDWSKRNLAAVKLLLGFFFAAMAVLLLWPK
jgi:cytochrome c biogenesis protein CcdA